MPRPICVPCGREMRCVKTGRDVLLTIDDGHPYEVWSGDEFGCPSCNHTVVVQFGREPIARHYEPDFGETWAKLLAHNPLVVQAR